MVVSYYEGRNFKKDMPSVYNYRVINPQGDPIWVMTSVSLIEYAGKQATIALITDINSLKQLEKEREKMILELQTALADVKTLSGLLPICAACKKIRDDKGYWNQIEAYIGKHSNAQFSHGMCPECAKKWFPDML
jgi:hypothetical protein